MTEQTSLLSLPYIMPSQAQKHVTHNEALRMLDALLQIRVEGIGQDTPPGTPAEGERHVVGGAPTGAFAGHAGEIACWQDGAWAFFAPRAGWLVWDASEDALMVSDGATWVPVFETQDIPLLGVNTAADTTNRLAVAAAATLLSHEGAGHQLKVNKAASGDTVSLLFQTNWSGRAEMGLAGNDDFSVKVSPDGAAWATALKVKAASGAVSVDRLGIGTEAPALPFHLVGRAVMGDSINNTRLTTGGNGARSFSLIDQNAMIRIWRVTPSNVGVGVEFAIGTASDDIGSAAIPWWDVYVQPSPEVMSFRRRTGQSARDYMTIGASGQVIIGGATIGGVNTPHASARLEVKANAPGDATLRGFLPPCMTTAQRDAIASPAEGLIVYNTTAHEPQFWNGSAWMGMTA